MKDKISLAAARRIAVAAQGFADPRPRGTVNRGHVRRVLDRIGLLQIDSVSVLVRAHYLPLFSRLGPYARELVDKAAWSRSRSLFEYWAHEASLVPIETYPFLRWRMARAAAHEGTGRLARFGRERRDYVETIYRTIVGGGPLVASDLDGEKGPGGWWGWGDAKHALEWLFWTGRITTATRRGFERVYDLTERVLPAAVVEADHIEPAAAHRHLLSIAARALGVATASDLRDYFRMSPEDAAGPLAELVDAGDLVPVSVEGWTQQAYLHKEARMPRRVEASALLAPFDPLVWERARTERLFGFRYRIEIYTPAEKRVHGYYVLPFLLGDRLVARVDLKSDRQVGALRVLSAHEEPFAPVDTAHALAAELGRMAAWLGLERVEVAAGEALGQKLGNAIGSSSGDDVPH